MRHKISDIPCNHCGKIFHPTHFKIKHCSRVCSNASRKGKPTWNAGLIGYRAGKNHHWFGRNMSGKNNPSYLGDKVGYRGLHKWVEDKLGKPCKCEHCGDSNLKHRQYHWANISRDYKREITDWRRLCAKCHKAFDKQVELGLN